MDGSSNFYADGVARAVVFVTVVSCLLARAA